MQKDFSDTIKPDSDCPHCNLKSFAYAFPLYESEKFTVICDVHPLIKGHLLIIPKQHLSCVGAYDLSHFNEVKELINKASVFLNKSFGKIAIFEHGIFGQSVFHSHIHLLPYSGDTETVVPEGKNHSREFFDISELKVELEINGGYLFLSIDNKNYLVDKDLVKPRFFRDRFAGVLDVAERGNWKEMRENEVLMKIAGEENREVAKLWSAENASSVC